MANKGKTYLAEKDLQDHPVWVISRVDDLIYPVFGPEDFPEENGDLIIRAIFKTVGGITFQGYIFGLQNIFTIAIFWNNEVLYMNRNLFDESLEEIDIINKNLETKIKPEEFSPLRYQTTIDLEHFKNFSGEFDVFKKPTDEERLNC